MNSYHFILAIFLFLHMLNVNSQYSSAVTNICDLCFCQYKDGKNQDFVGEIVDCSYKPDILSTNLTLPTTVHCLDLSTNGLKTVNKSPILASKSMKRLLLHHNDISTVNADALYLPELTILDLSYNNLAYINEDIFKGLNKLQYLNLANNNITYFEKFTFQHLNTLQELVLDNNNLGKSLRQYNLFEYFGLTNKINSLSLKAVQLEKVPENFFSYAYDLKKLVISKNNLVELFEIPYTLEYLDVSDNPITYIYMEDFSDLPALKVLKLNNLQIKTLPDFVFTPLKSLMHLELERNLNLTSFSPLAFGQEVLDDSDDFTLETLSFKGSKLRSLDERLLEPFGRLLRLDLQKNPWRCDCKLAWVKQLQIAEEDYQQLRCAYPPALSNQKIFLLDSQFFACPINRHYMGLIIAGVSFCIILACLAVWMFVFLPRWQSRSRCMKHLVGPVGAYSILPMNYNREPFELY